MVDFRGNTLFTKHYAYPNHFVSTGKMIPLFDGNYLDVRLLGYEDNQQVQYGWLWVIKLNPQGDTLFTKHLRDSTIRYLDFKTVIQKPDSGFLVVCINKKNGGLKQEPVLLELNKSFDEIRRKIIPSADREGFYSVAHYINGGFVLSGYGTTGGINESSPFVVRVDSNLNVIWRKWYPIRISAAAILDVDQAKNIVFCTDSFHYETGGREFSRKQLYKIDSSGNVLWRKSHGPVGRFNYYLKVLEVSDGNLVVLGQEGPDTSTYQTHSTLTKVSPDGDIIWLRRYVYETWDAHDYTWDFIQTEDKGFLLVGDEHGLTQPTQDVWLLKVDSNGCKPGCTIFGEEDTTSVQVLQKDEPQFGIYPNPTASSIQIKSPIPIVQLEFFDLSGQLVESFVHPSVHIPIELSFPKGVYFYQAVLSTEEVVTGRLIKDE